MSSIYVCSLQEMPQHVSALRPARLVSLVLPEEQPATPPEISPGRHLRLEIDDISEPLQGQLLPEAKHVEALIEFFRGWEEQDPLLVHCMAGISRSMAAALIAMAQRSPGRELEAAALVRAAAPHAHPNRRMVQLADEILGCAGRLSAGLEAMGPAELRLAGPLVRLPRCV